MPQFACVKAISVYLPKKIEKNAELMGKDEKFVAKLGITERHMAASDESAGDLAFQAAENMFQEYAIPRESIDYILLCVQHPDYQAPTTACHLQARLGLSQSCGALDYGLGCSGYIYGLSLAKGLIETSVAHNVLLLTSSVYTKYINRNDNAIRPLFGDGATATLITAQASDVPLIHSFVLGTDGSGFDKLYIPVGGSRNPPREHPEIVETDEAGNSRSNYEIHMDSSAIFYFTLRVVPSLVEEILKKAQLQRQDIQYYVFHQSNGYMMGHIQKKCGLEGMPFYDNIKTVGNTVSGTIPFALKDILGEKSPASLENVMLAGFGVGLSWGGCIVNLQQMLSPKA